ncbi:MAG TPA: hypothetical protein VGF12_00990 [Roseateles sp.]|uniref:hypothetical protein n=1 Tax=Roseateles sp. TaxID=1971397 RepID=UPI002EDB8210
MKRLTIGIDFDDTFTADPDLWRRFIGDAQRSGHVVVCVTARREPPDFSRSPRLPDSVQIVCAGQDWKRHAAARAGFNVDIWIDDIPSLIEPSRVLDFGQ